MRPTGPDRQRARRPGHQQAVNRVQTLHWHGLPRLAQDLGSDPEGTESEGAAQNLLRRRAIGRVSDGVTAERRHAGMPPATFLPRDQPGQGELGTAAPPPMLAGDTRPGDRGKSLEYSDEGEGA
jgi:hypothetical protein